MALFPTLLGDAFASLDGAVRRVHGGSSQLWHGRATVARGQGLRARLAAWFARLPMSGRDVSVRVQIVAREEGEEWTRYFGTSRGMHSRLWAHNGFLVERLGLVEMRFRLVPKGAGIHWHVVRVALGPVRLPVRLFSIQSCSMPGPMGYRFIVAARVTGIGELIRYEGDLEVTRD